MQSIGRLSFVWAFVVLTAALQLHALSAAELLKQQPPNRTWQSSSGEHKIKATLLDARDGKVQLKKADGAKIWVPLDALSRADQTYVREQAAKLNLKTPNPFDVGVAPPSDLGVKQTSPYVKRDEPTGKSSIKPVKRYGIDWYDADDATTLATKERKPVMWFRVLGDLDGFM